MPKPKAADPRVVQVLLRLTTRHGRVLDAVAHLEGTTANLYARDLLEAHLKVVDRHPRVQADLDNRSGYEAEKATTTPIGPGAARVGRADPAEVAATRVDGTER